MSRIWFWIGSLVVLAVMAAIGLITDLPGFTLLATCAWTPASICLGAAWARSGVKVRIVQESTLDDVSPRLRKIAHK